jgi:WD40 repeat protein
VVAFGDQRGTVHLQSLQSGRPIATLVGHTGPAAFVLFNKDASLVCAGGPDGRVDIWDVASRRRDGPSLQPGGGNVWGFFDRADPNRFWTVSTGLGSIKGGRGPAQVVMWDRHDPEHHRRLGAPFRFQPYPGAFPFTSVSADGRLLDPGDAAGPASVWDVPSHTLLHLLPGGNLPFVGNSTTMATGQGDHISLWDAITGRPQGAAFPWLRPD